jgi:hypothetical protein
MRITSVEMPRNGGTFCFGVAESSRGARYQWSATLTGECCSVFREHPDETLPDGRTFWLIVKTPRGLRKAVRDRLRREMH